METRSNSRAARTQSSLERDGSPSKGKPTPLVAFSPQPAKAALERLYIFYTPIWTAFIAFVILGGHYRRLDDPGYMLLGISAMLPLWVWPFLYPPPSELGRPIWERTSFRANCFIWVLSYIGNFGITEYFFELLGMRYTWPLKWNFDAVVIGKQLGDVPFWLTPLTHAYFATYHGIMSVAWRTLDRRFRLGKLGNLIVLLALAYFFAFAETFFMASDIIKDVFEYREREKMLVYGSLFYAVFFLFSFPVFYWLDETAEESKRSFGDVMLRALGVCMCVMMALEHWAFIAGPLVAPETK